MPLARRLSETLSRASIRKRKKAMPSKIAITVLYVDDDLISLKVAASSERFSGQVEFYEKHDSLAKFAEDLSGFPSCATDTKQFELGAFTSGYAGGGAHFVFSCTDALGHAAIEVQLHSQNHQSGVVEQSAKMIIKVDASTIDAFVRDLKAMELEVDANAYMYVAL